MRLGAFTKTSVVLVAILLAGTFFARPLMERIILGLDLQGGVHVRLQAVEKPDRPVTDEDMAQLVKVMRQRVDELGVSEPVIQLEGDRRLIVELAGISDTEQAVEIIGKTAQLEFRTYDGKVVLSGDDLKNAQASIDPTTNRPQINLEFNAEGTKIFAQLTSELVANYTKEDPRRRIAIFLDDQLLTNPTVDEPIPTGQARITGGFADFKDAENTAALLRGGALPVAMEIIAKRTVGPTLGMDSLKKSGLAIKVGLVTILLFMVGYYRLPGLLANFSLVVYALIVLSLLVLLKATLTLPGIAGLLLSVGMAVDANVIIFERLREELKDGKTIRSAVEAAFRRAFWTIFDANVTTLLAAAVLYQFGTGPIRGFAVTLSIGILTSMLTAITLTRWLLRLAVGSSTRYSTRLFGVQGGQ